MLMQWRGVPDCGGALALWGLVVTVLWIWLVFPALPQACEAAETKHSANPGPLCVAPARPFRWRRSRAAQAPGATKPRSGFTLTAARSSASHRCGALLVCALARCDVCVLWVWTLNTWRFRAATCIAARAACGHACVHGVSELPRAERRGTQGDSGLTIGTAPPPQLSSSAACSVAVELPAQLGRMQHRHPGLLNALVDEFGPVDKTALPQHIASFVFNLPSGT